MLCLELLIPPLPTLVTVKKATFPKPFRHHDRTFPLYDIIIVRSGRFYITEEDTPYEIQDNQMLILEPGKRHYGHLACQPGTVLYYLHVQHPSARRLLPPEEIRWHSVLPVPTYHELEPQEQFMYLPKFKELKTNQIWSILDEMAELRSSSVLERMLPLQAMFVQLLMLLQNQAKTSHNHHSRQVCDNMIAYLNDHIDKPFRLDEMARQLNFSVDYLSKCLKKHTTLTPLQYLNGIRMRKARDLLEFSELSLHEISAKVGISDINYFFRLFRKTIGVPPAKYRASFYAEEAADLART
ncbi:helix-turn-helix transcriptional regulator [Paenibacillus sp. GCM10023248]|uniref:helix-turn-helix transcriptional regulator n=1 Tax=Bacillales TaxID=1385 RepID=UPI002379A8F8|nr:MULTISPECIES: AraC family transcriptional regulator [Bacillales]MDD9267296.1 AraC family transcriptional regulator [Paenibacillus sp. MAHUQ-63]MDR6884797.1 AraC-like DNA-binding protein [Bacillus sp. 3255]